MTITMEGALSKWTNVMKGWQYRWFVLDDSAGIFSYYTSKDKMTRGVRRGCVRLRGALIGIDDEVRLMIDLLSLIIVILACQIILEKRY